MSLKGYCKECGNEIQNEDKMDTHGIWEYDRCGYPHSDEAGGITEFRYSYKAGQILNRIFSISINKNNGYFKNTKEYEEVISILDKHGLELSCEINHSDIIEVVEKYKENRVVVIGGRVFLNGKLSGLISSIYIIDDFGVVKKYTGIMKNDNNTGYIKDFKLNQIKKSWERDNTV